MRSAQLYDGSSAKITPEQNSNDTTIQLKINVTEHWPSWSQQDLRHVGTRIAPDDGMTGR